MVAYLGDIYVAIAAQHSQAASLGVQDVLRRLSMELHVAKTAVCTLHRGVQVPESMVRFPQRT